MDEINIYTQKIASVLQGAGNVRISNFVDEHLKVKPILHPKAEMEDSDISALVYTILRLPTEIFNAKTIVMAQNDSVFNDFGVFFDENWEDATAVARRRKFKYNKKENKLAVFITSKSDVEDIVTVLTAFYIEVLKLNKLVCEKGRRLFDCFSETDYEKFIEVLGENLNDFLNLASSPADYELSLLAGSLVDYAKAIQEWWVNIALVRKKYGFDLYKKPVYFVSSNSHSIINLLSGFAVKQKQNIFLDNKKRLIDNRVEFAKEMVSNENICYYLSRFTEEKHKSYADLKLRWEDKFGLVRLKPNHSVDIEAQVFSVKDFVKNDFLDRRIKINPQTREILSKSDALILNIAYPLGLTAYTILKEVSENVRDIRGVYILGKAASLNCGVGDIMIPNFVFDAHTENQIFVKNIFEHNDFSDYFPKGSILSDQKAISAKGTFLQNKNSLMTDYEKGYALVEMEAGPYLNRIYEMQYPNRHPIRETFVINPKFRLGLAYYISDTPHKKGVNLGAKRLTWEGLNATYAVSLGVVNDILKSEIDRLSTEKQPNT